MGKPKGNHRILIIERVKKSTDPKFLKDIVYAYRTDTLIMSHVMDNEYIEENVLEEMFFGDTKDKGTRRLYQRYAVQHKKATRKIFEAVPLQDRQIYFFAKKNPSFPGDIEFLCTLSS